MTTPAHRAAAAPPRHAVSETLVDGKLTVNPDTPPATSTPAPAAPTSPPAAEPEDGGRRPIPRP